MSEVVLITSPMVLSKEGPAVGDEFTNPWLGVLYLASYLEKNGIKVSIVDPGPEKLLLSDIIRRVKAEKPKIVAISTLTSGIKTAVQMANEIKKVSPKIKIGIGGSHINVDPTFAKRFPCFDFSVVGEGEATLLEIVHLARKNKRLKKVYQGKIIHNLDEIPFPARHLIDIYNYFPREKRNSKEKPTASIVGSRGCPYLCSFCSRNPQWRVVRFRSAKNIVDEMEAIGKDYDWKFSFQDDAITLNKKVAMEICEEIISRKLKLRFLGMTRANCVDEELVQKMAQAGCEELFFGVEAGNEKIRNKVIKKMVTDKEIKRAIDLCRKYKIRSSLFLMLGFPGETEKEINDTVNFGSKFNPDFVGVHVTIPLPGSEIFELAKKEGLIPKDIIDRYASGQMGEGFIGNWPIYVPRGLTQEYLYQAQKRAYRQFYLRPRWLWQRFLTYFYSPGNLIHDIGLIKTGIITLLYGSTKNAITQEKEAERKTVS